VAIESCYTLLVSYQSISAQSLLLLLLLVELKVKTHENRDLAMRDLVRSLLTIGT